jgi:hypothetical protein
MGTFQPVKSFSIFKENFCILSDEMRAKDNTYYRNLAYDYEKT